MSAKLHAAINQSPREQRRLLEEIKAGKVWRDDAGDWRRNTRWSNSGYAPPKVRIATKLIRYIEANGLAALGPGGVWHLTAAGEAALNGE